MMTSKATLVNATHFEENGTHPFSLLKMTSDRNADGLISNIISQQYIYIYTHGLMDRIKYLRFMRSTKC